MSDTDRMSSLEAEIEGLQWALKSRDVIAQAKGMIRLLAETDDDGAFLILVDISSKLNIKVRDLAALLIEILPGRADRLPPEVTRQLKRHLKRL